MMQSRVLPKSTVTVPAAMVPETPSTAASTRVPALDGVRGVAVAVVVLFHFGVPFFSGGFLGVDLFFVLSGYLITSLLLDERARRGRIDLVAFWGRRVRRLLPALFVVLASVLAAAPLLAVSAQERLRGDVLSTLAYLANWHFMLSGRDYFSQAASPSPLQHLWSLGIEEQFYLAWPLVATLVLRRSRGIPFLRALAIMGGAFSVVLMLLLYHSSADVSRVYYGTDTRAQALLAGCTAALVVRSWHTIPRWLGPAAAGAVGVLVVCTLFASGGSPWLYRGGFAVITAAMAVLIADCVLRRRGALARILSVAPLRGLGRISYSVYLWHWPVFVLLTGERTKLSGPVLLLVRLGTTLGLSVLTFFAIEEPFLRTQLRWRRLAPLAAAAAVIALVTVWLPSPAASPDSYAARALTAPAGTAQRLLAHAPVQRAPVAAGAPAVVNLMGDSMALSLGVGLAPAAASYGIRLVNRGVSSCGIAPGNPVHYYGSVRYVPTACSTWSDAWANAIAHDDPDVVLVLLGRWEVTDRVYEGRWTDIDDPAFDAVLLSQLSRAVQILTARGAHVVLLTTPYLGGPERADGGQRPEFSSARVDHWNAMLRETAESFSPLVSVMDLGGRLSPGGKYAASVDHIPARTDGIHLTAQIGRRLAPWLLSETRRLAGSTATSGR